MVEEEPVHEHVVERGQLGRQLNARQHCGRGPTPIRHGDHKSDERRVRLLDQGDDFGGESEAEKEALVIGTSNDVDTSFPHHARRACSSRSKGIALTRR